MSSPPIDILIVGAGFAGSACALAAAHAGLHVTVLERKRDPGERPHTSGILVREALDGTLLGDAPAACLHRVERVALYSPRLRRLDLHAPGYAFHTTDTPALMRWLGTRLAGAGVDLRLGQSFTDARRVAGGWHVDGVGRVRCLVGADGARSRVAGRVGLSAPREFLYGIEHEFDGARLGDPGALHCFVSRRFAPGYIGWAAQTPTGVQAGLACRHDAARPRRPDIAGFLARVAPTLGLGLRTPDSVRAGLIPCGGPRLPLARDAAYLTGHAAGLVSPVTAGGIHAAWKHGHAVGEAIAAHLLHGGPDPARRVHAAAPRFRRKRLLRWAFDTFQCDWPVDLLLHSGPMRWAASQVYFHRSR